jgi:hypothetical protein
MCWFDGRPIATVAPSIVSRPSLYPNPRARGWTDDFRGSGTRDQMRPRWPGPCETGSLPVHLIMNVITPGYFTLARQGGVIWRSKLDALRGLPAALRKRPAIQAQRRVLAFELLRVMDTNMLDLFEDWSARRALEDDRMSVFQGACVARAPASPRPRASTAGFRTSTACAGRSACFPGLCIP